MQQFLVTGANGHLGYNVCLLLKSEGYLVRALVLPHDDATRLEQLGVDVFRGDVTKPSSLEHFFNCGHPSETLLIHCAGIVSITNKNVAHLYKVNVEGSHHIVEMFKKYQLAKMVYVSSVHAIPEGEKGSLITEPASFDGGQVVGDYAKSKATTSEYMKKQAREGVPIVLVHPSGIIGPFDEGHGHLTMMIEDYLNGQLTSRVKGAYDFVDVRDVARGVLGAALKGRSGESYILSGHLVDLKVFFDLLRKLSGRTRMINVLPTWFAHISAPLAEFYYRLRRRPPIYSKYSLYTISSNAYFSSAKAESELGYQKTSFEDTIKATVKWLSDSGKIKHKRVNRYIKEKLD